MSIPRLTAENLDAMENACYRVMAKHDAEAGPREKCPPYDVAKALLDTLFDLQQTTRDAEQIAQQAERAAIRFQERVEHGAAYPTGTETPDEARYGEIRGQYRAQQKAMLRLIRVARVVFPDGLPDAFEDSDGE